MPREDQTDNEKLWIETAIAGDKHAFGRLYELYANRIFSYLYYRMDGRAEAADMTETVFLKAWENLPQFGRTERGLNFRAWLYRIAHNAVIDRHRTKKEEISLDTLDEQSAGLPHVGQLLEESEQLEVLLAALDQLDPLSRQVITLRFFSGLDHRETASITGLTNSNVRVIQYRALKKLKELMGHEDE